MRLVAPIGFFAALRMTNCLPGLLVAAVGVSAADVRPRMLLLDGAVVGSEIVVVGERGTILRSSDNARTWQATPRAATATLTGISFAPSPSTSAPASALGWAVGHDALILGTSDGGRAWARQFQGENLQDSFLDVLALDAQHVVAVGAYALYFETKDSGKSWAKRKVTEDDFHFNRITRGPTGTLYLAGERGTVLKSTDAGTSWRAIGTPYDGSFFGVLPLDARTLLAHGLRGQVFRSTDDGATWERIATPQPVILATALRQKSDTLLLAGGTGTLLASHDGGRNFAPTGVVPTKAIAELIELPNGSLLALGEAGATLIEAGRIGAPSR